MTSDRDDLVGLLSFAGERLHARVQGLADAEWTWRPVPAQPRISIRWRVDHIIGLLREPRNWTWLGVVAPGPPTAGAADSAAAATADLDNAVRGFRSLVERPDVELQDEIGPAAGPWARATRRSFVLHVADELIHHGAEVALLRDLYLARHEGP